MTVPHHITACICTFRRPELLRGLLQKLAEQETDGLFSYSLVVADNDAGRSAEPVVLNFRARSTIPIVYCVEARQNIALARNRAIANATGDLLAFIDDDELPTSRWLLTLFQTLTEYEVDGVLGPVKPSFPPETPLWVIKGKFYERPTYATGMVVEWRKGRTGNTLLRRAIFPEGQPWFQKEFLVGEDQDLFRRMIANGHVFVWCNEAIAYEDVPPLRWKRSFMLRRALLRGRMSLVHPTAGMLYVAKSLAAVPAYILILPIALCLGQAKCMDIAIRLCDHIGRLLAVLGINPVREPYVTG